MWIPLLVTVTCLLKSTHADINNCLPGFYNVSIPIPEEPHPGKVYKPYECKPAYCNVSKPCPGPPVAFDGSKVCEKSGTIDPKSEELQNKIYNSTRKHVMHSTTQDVHTIFKIPFLNALTMNETEINTNAFSWNLWRKSTATAGFAANEEPVLHQCDKIPGTGTLHPLIDGGAKMNGCSNVYTQFMLVHDPARCWPIELGIPIIANNYTTASQMRQCRDVVMHLLSAKPPGSYVTQPYEQRDAFLLRKPVITCGNNEKGPNPSARNRGYPQLPAFVQGGGAEWYRPWTYAESTGMCKFRQTDTDFDLSILSPMFQQGGVRYGGTVQVEEYGHTIFDTAIPYFDPQGWKAVQKAAKIARFKSSRTPDPDWDCFTSATEYFAAGVELMLYNTRIGENLKVKSRTELRNQDPNLYCLVARYYETNNKWRPCAEGPNDGVPVQFNASFCRRILRDNLNITKFAPGVPGNSRKAENIVNTNLGSGTLQELQARGACAPPTPVPSPTPTPTPTVSFVLGLTPTPAQTLAPTPTPVATANSSEDTFLEVTIGIIAVLLVITLFVVYVCWNPEMFNCKNFKIRAGLMTAKYEPIAQCDTARSTAFKL